MSKIQMLLKAYEAFVSLPWQSGLSGREKVWFCIYEPRDERRLRMNIQEFELATQKAGHGWTLFDVTSKFEEWLCANEYRDSYFAEPGLLSPSLDLFKESLAKDLREQLRAADKDSVVAVLGVGSLFGITSVSGLLDKVSQDIAGTLVVFFPGAKSGHNYRLLDAKDGWSYLAVPIQAEERI